MFFTSNVSKTPIINNSTKSLNFDESNNNYLFRLYAKTKNIVSDGLISYKMKDEEGNDVSNYLNVQNNKVAQNDVNPLITINHTIPAGDYTIVTSYNDVEEEIPISIKSKYASVYYYANNGTDENVVETVETETPFQLKANNFMRQGYTFKEWNTKYRTYTYSNQRKYCRYFRKY